MTGAALYDIITGAATLRGENDELDHEVGDLQDALRVILVEEFAPRGSLDNLHQRMREELTELQE